MSLVTIINEAVKHSTFLNCRQICAFQINNLSVNGKQGVGMESCCQVVQEWMAYWQLSGSFALKLGNGWYMSEFG